MAAPGEFFPVQFAMGLLQLQQQSRESTARLQQLKDAQAQQSTLEAQRNQTSQFQAQTGRLSEIAAAGHAEAQGELQKQKLAFEIKQHEDLLKNQDENAFKQLGAGQDAFIRSGGPQPSPELLEGPEITTAEGVKKPAFKFSKVELPGHGTYYHKFDDVHLQQQYEKADLENRNLISQSVLRQKQAVLAEAHAGSFTKEVEVWKNRKITLEEAETVRKAYDEAVKVARERAHKLIMETLITPDPAKQQLAAALLADPYYDASPEDKARGQTYKAILEAYAQKLAKGFSEPTAPPQSLTGTHPSEVQANVEKGQALFGHTPEGAKDLKAQATGSGQTIEHVTLHGGEAGRLRIYYGDKGQPIGSDVINSKNKIISSTGVSPYAVAAGAKAPTPASRPAPIPTVSPPGIKSEAEIRTILTKIQSGTPPSPDDLAALRAYGAFAKSK